MFSRLDDVKSCKKKQARTKKRIDGKEVDATPYTPCRDGDAISFPHILKPTVTALPSNHFLDFHFLDFKGLISLDIQDGVSVHQGHAKACVDSRQTRIYVEGIFL
jgi:hypothetical protein